MAKWWVCCQCKAVLESDGDVLVLEWDEQIVYACPECGHKITASCCVGRGE